MVHTAEWQRTIASDDAFAPETATDERAFPATLYPDDDWLQFASGAEEVAYYKGMTHGICSMGRDPAHPHMPAGFRSTLAGEARRWPGSLSTSPPDSHRLLTLCGDGLPRGE